MGSRLSPQHQIMTRILTVTVLVLTVAIICADAFCCNWVLTKDMKAQCGDGSYVHPWQCCTTGSCNVFCCNCDQPCLSNPLVPLLRKAVNAEMDELEQALNDI